MAPLPPPPPSTTAQLAAWTTEFGRAYTDRNTMTADEMDAAFAAQLGTAKSAIYRELVGPDRLPSGRALEVGCNIGLQLELLHRANPALELHGIDPQSYALDRARRRLPAFRFHQASAFDVPFGDASFDLVFTHGVLIHVAPDDWPRALREIHRVSRRFILCHEYYSSRPTELRYHDRAELLWKTDFAGRYQELFADLCAVSIRLYPYRDGSGPDRVDQIALFEKAAPP
jgi:pseudaminic acid biosynthesis-associated methylase